MLKTFQICIYILLFVVNSLYAKELTVIYTAETHGMIDECDCPKKPDGGIFRRATLIKEISMEMRGNILVLDGGGAFAGGLDDQYTMGDELDKERTIINLRGMAKMGYDAVCLGDDEFGFGINFLNTVRAETKIPFLSCNIFYKGTSKLFAEPYIIRKINGIAVAIIGVTTQELLTGEYFDKVKSLEVADPISQVGRYVKKLRKDADVVILLSHLGDDLTEELVEKVKGLDIVINSHRWKKAEFKKRINGTLVVQFNYQGKKIGRIDLNLNDKNKIISSEVREIEVSHLLEGDPDLLQMVTGFRENVEFTKKKKVKLDLYVMSYCPYGTRAEEVIFQLLDKFRGKVDLNIYYIVSRKDDKFTSLHGNKELEEDLRQVCVKRLKPERLYDYILCVNAVKENEEGWKECAEKTDINPQDLNECISSGEAKRELAVHYNRKMRLRVEGSPTLYVNNRRFRRGFSNEMVIAKEICDQLPNSDQLLICQDLPECFSDGDCWKEGYIGKCEEGGTRRGRCVYEKDEEFTFSVLTSSKGLMTNEADIINSTKSIFPGMKLKIIELNSEEGQRFKEKYKINKLPAYHFETNVQNARNFTNVKSSFIKVTDGYLISPEAVGASLDLTRERIPGQILFFFASLSQQANDIVVEIINRIKEKPGTYNIEFHYLVAKDEEGNFVSRRGISEIEENIRQLVVKKHFPEKYYDYIVERAKEVGSSYWEDAALAVGLDPASIKKLARSKEGESLLEAEYELVKELQIGGEFVFFVNNQEVIYLRNRGELERLLEKIVSLTRRNN